jgi:hypothetical protein
MRPPRVALGLILAATLAHAIGHAQAPAAGPTFDVVSIKPSPPQTGGPVFRINAMTQRPDGGVTIAYAERRELPSFDLRLANRDGTVGPGLTRSEVDCEAVLDPNARRPCTFVNGLSGASGEATMATLASMLRGPAGRVVVNRTGLTGSFRVSLTFEPVAIPGLSTTAPSGDPPSVFTAVREQLGLRLDPSRIERDVLVIDHIERPTEN